MCLPSGELCSSVTGNGLNDLKLGGHFLLHMRIISQFDNVLKGYSLITTWLFSFPGYCKIAPLNATTHIWIIFLVIIILYLSALGYIFSPYLSSVRGSVSL